MALPINVEDLLRQRKVESNRIEFKKGWNPDRIYRSVCAFANDFDNIGGGYILVGVEEENGVAKRPVSGVPTEQIDTILKDMTNFNNRINPYYLPRTEPLVVDNKSLLYGVRPVSTVLMMCRNTLLRKTIPRKSVISAPALPRLRQKATFLMNFGTWLIVYRLMIVAIRK